MQHSRHQLGVKVRSPLAQREGFHIWFSSKTRCAWHDNKKQFKSICIFFIEGQAQAYFMHFSFGDVQKWILVQMMLRDSLFLIQNTKQWRLWLTRNFVAETIILMKTIMPVREASLFFISF